MSRTSILGVGPLTPDGKPNADYQAKWDAWHKSLADRQNRSYQRLAKASSIGIDVAKKAARKRAANAKLAERIAAENARKGSPDALLTEARQVAQNAADSSFTRLTARQTKKLESVHEKLLDFLDNIERGENEAVIGMVEQARRLVDGALTSASFFAAFAKTPAQCREAWVCHVAVAWHRHTGLACTSSRNAQKSGMLNKTPLVRFVRAMLDDVLPTLSDGEIQRGIEVARALVAQGSGERSPEAKRDAR